MIKLKLKEFQKENVEKAKSMGEKIIFADKSGLGKRAQSIGLLDEYYNGKLVIITNKNIKELWSRSICQFSNKILNNEINIIEKMNERLTNGCNIVSFEYALKNENIIKDFLIKDGILIIDQNRRFKKKSNKITGAIYNIASTTKYVSLLVGLGEYQKAQDFENLLNFLNPNKDYSYLNSYLGGKKLSKFNQYLTDNFLVKTNQSVNVV